MTDVYTKAVFTVIAFALVGLAVRPNIEPGRVDAQGPTFEQRLDRLEHNAEVMRSAANANAHALNVRFSRASGRRHRRRARGLGRCRGDGRALGARDPAPHPPESVP